MAYTGRANIGAGQTPNSVSVSNSSTQIIAANASRKWCFLTNIGNKDVFVAVGQTALVNKGFLLGKNGGGVLMDASAISLEALNGITSAGASVIMFQEGN